MRRLLLLANVLAILVIAAVIAFHIMADREHVVADAMSDVMNLRDALSENTRQILTGVTLALTGIAESIDPNDMTRDETFRALRVRQDIFAPTFAFFVLDEEGRLVATSRTRDPDPVEFSDDPMFTAHRDRADLGLLISAPRQGRVGFAEGNWIIPISRRLNHTDGSFAGIAAAAVSIDYLTAFYESMRIGDGGVVGIMKDDGTVLAHSPFQVEYLGQDVSDTRIFRELLPSSDKGSYRAPFVTDGVDRFIAYGRVTDFPVVVCVGVSTTERLAGWRLSALTDGTLGLLAIAIAAGFSVLLSRRIDERQKAQETRVAQLTKLTEISAALLRSPDMATALQRATDMARELVPCHQAVTSLTEHPSMAQAIHTVSLSEKYARWRSYDEKPDGSGIYREVSRTNRSMRLTQADLEAHAAWKGFGAAKGMHPPMRGWLAVPLVADDGANLGLIQLSDRESGEFTAEDEILMIELAHVTSVAIQRLMMAEELRSAATTADHLRADAEAARLSEERARSEIEKILTSIHDAVFALDSQWRFTFVNRHAEEVLERSAVDLIGRNLWEEFPEAIGSEAYIQYHKALNENVDVAFRFFYPPLKRWFDVRAFPQDQGGLTVYFQDVSGWVIQEEQLRQSQRMEAVGQLTGGVAHDFNNLLQVILGNSEALLADLDDADANYRLVEMIGEAAERAGDLTQRLLAFSRRQPLAPKAVDINALVTDLEPLLKRTLGEQYDVALIRRPRTERAVVDPGQLQNAIINLAVNARDAMPEGGELTIETDEVVIDEDFAEMHRDVTPGHYVTIAVSDDGVGMTPDVRSRAFEPFFTTKKVGEGTGLGLSMVYGFAKQSGGHVNIYSEPGEGTVVTLYLPCAEADHASPSSLEIADAVERGTERILVVEDDMLVREYTTTTLTSLGYDVTTVADGPAALALLDTDDSFDLLLCDVILSGGMNGRQVAEAAHQKIRDLKVLYMSGYTENVIVHHGRLDADARLLQKPFRRGDLARKVREVLDDRS